MQPDEHRTVLTTTQARQAERMGVLHVLLASLALAAIVGLGLTLYYFGVPGR